MTRSVGWGIIGAGNIARSFAEGLRAIPDARLVAVSSRTAASAEAFARSYRVARVHADAAALVRDPDVDVVYVATPHHRHARDSILCLEGGKAVLCEKPFTLNAAQAREVVRAARHNRRFCMEAMWMRFIPAIRKVKELLDGGAIGEPRMMSADFYIPFAFNPSSRIFDPAQGGGALLDIGIYPLSLAFLLLGEPTSITSHAVLGTTGVDEQSAIILGYPGGRMALLSASLRTRGPTEAVIAGSTGAIRIASPMYRPSTLTITRFGAVGQGPQGQRSLKQLIVSRVRATPVVRELALGLRALALRLLRPEARMVTLPVEGNGYHYQAVEVMRCLRSGELESPLMPLDESLRIMETMDRIRAQWGLRYPGE